MAELPQAVASASPRTEWRRGTAWLKHGWNEFRRDQALWLTLALLYSVTSGLLGAVLGVMGLLVVILFTPMLLAGLMLSMANGELRAGINIKQNISIATDALTRALRSETYIYLIILLGIVTLGLVLVVQIIQSVLKIGSLSNLFSSSIGAAVSPWWRWTGSLILLLLNVWLMMGLFYSVHRTALARRDAMQSVHESFVGVWRHAVAHVPYLVCFAIFYVMVASAFSANALWGFAVWLVVGTALVPFFVIASYRSYCEVFS
jgi:hypothetical protein